MSLCIKFLFSISYPLPLLLNPSTPQSQPQQTKQLEENSQILGFSSTNNPPPTKSIASLERLLIKLGGGWGRFGGGLGGVKEGGAF